LIAIRFLKTAKLNLPHLEFLKTLREGIPQEFLKTSQRLEGNLKRFLKTLREGIPQEFLKTSQRLAGNPQGFN
jgi:hypothetical protein